jgi:exosortase/archaeosortase family protein
LLRDWPLSLEYVIFAIFFASAVLLAYGKGALTFSISLSLLGVIALVYMIDTIYPFGLFNPLQSFALPTAASSAAFLELLGYQGVRLAYPVAYSVGNQVSLLPELYIVASNGRILAQALIGWSCAGVHSLLLYILIMLMFLKRSGISSFRKSVYFIFGLFGTYFVNILRISSFFIIWMNYGQSTAMVFHDNYGELYFFIWISMYVMLIVGIQRFMLIERTRYTFHILPEKTRYTLNKLGSYSANKIRKLSSYLKTKLKQLQMKFKR